jgi:predicted NUDIX family NTP pyrophosphohydrolase
MPRAQSAAVVLYRRRHGMLEVLLVHPGGPFWAKRDEGAWSFPKGEFGDGENPQDAARREFEEETGLALAGELVAMTAVRQKSGKLVHPFAVEGDADAAAVASNSFELEWPRGSGIVRRFPEVDRAGWFDIGTAQSKLIEGQRPILRELEARVVLR